MTGDKPKVLAEPDRCIRLVAYLEAIWITELKKILDLEFTKYILLATTNIVIYYAIFSSSVYFSGDYIVSTTLASILSLTINFIALKNVLFKKITRSIYALFFRYLAAYFVCYILNLFLLRLCVQYNLNIYVGGLIILPPSALVGYLLVKHFVFSSIPK